jgi:IclR family pca regulon transcriptional regulator
LLVESDSKACTAEAVKVPFLSLTSGNDAAAQHVSRTLRALELFATGPRTQAELARDLVVHRRTARRLIARLEQEGYVEATKVGRQVSYAATPRLIVLGRQVADDLDLVAIAKRHLEAVDGDLVSSRSVAVLSGRAVTFPLVERVDPGERANSVAASGEEAPLHAIAAGKIFLSADAGLLEDVLHQELVPFTERTLVTRADLLVELATIRAQGYATEDGEHRAGERAVASGILNHAGDTVAALCATPTRGAALEELRELIRGAALACSREIGAKV